MLFLTKGSGKRVRFKLIFNMIETPRLLLRAFIDEDAEGIFLLDADPEVHRYLGNQPITALQKAVEIIQHVQGQYLTNGIGRWAVLEKATGEFVGWAGLKYEQHHVTGERYYDLGYRLRRKFWGRGIASEVAAVWIEYGFERMNLTEIGAAAHIENAASNRILQKSGFEAINTFDSHGATHNWYILRREAWRGGSQ